MQLGKRGCVEGKDPGRGPSSCLETQKSQPRDLAAERSKREVSIGWTTKGLYKPHYPVWMLPGEQDSTFSSEGSLWGSKGNRQEERERRGWQTALWGHWVILRQGGGGQTRAGKAVEAESGLSSLPASDQPAAMQTSAPWADRVPGRAAETPNLPFTWHLSISGHLASRTGWSTVGVTPCLWWKSWGCKWLSTLPEVTQQHVAEQSSNQDQNCLKMSMKTSGYKWL